MEVELMLAMLEGLECDNGKIEKCLSAVSTAPYVSVGDTDEIPKRKSKPERGEGDDVKAKVKKHELQTNSKRERVENDLESYYIPLSETSPYDSDATLPLFRDDAADV